MGFEDGNSAEIGKPIHSKRVDGLITPNETPKPQVVQNRLPEKERVTAIND